MSKRVYGSVVTTDELMSVGSPIPDGYPVTRYHLNKEMNNLNNVLSNKINKKEDKLVIIDGGAGDVTMELPHDKYVVYGELTNLNISLQEAENGITPRYAFQFESGDTPTVITWPEGLKWLEDDICEPVVNKGYQVSIVNGIAHYGKYSL